MRYCTATDTYYMHGNESVCRQLAAVVGVEEGAWSIDGVKRLMDEAQSEVLMLLY